MQNIRLFLQVLDILALPGNGIRTIIMTNNYYGIISFIWEKQCNYEISEFCYCSNPVAVFDDVESGSRDMLLCSLRLSWDYKPTHQE